MPKPRKSLSQLAESGTLQKNIGRYKDRIDAQMTVITPIGGAPRHLLTNERAIWTEVVKNAPPGLLERSDRLIIEVLTRLVARIRSNGCRTSDLNATVAVLSRLGMTPIDRARMGLEAATEPTVLTKEEQAWADL